MSEKSVNHQQALPTAPQQTARRQNVLQRKCACGGAPGPTGECAACRRKRQLGRPPQPKLRVNRPGDVYEREADEVASLVMRLDEGRLQRQKRGREMVQTVPLLHRITPLVQRQVGLEEEEEEEDRSPSGAVGSMAFRKVRTNEPILRQVEPATEVPLGQQPAEQDGNPCEVPPGFQNHLKAGQNSGVPLPAMLREKMEARFGIDFGPIRVHTGSRASEMAASIQAQAFTVGHDIFFGAGFYRPGRADGQHLLAHELVHTLQQNPAMHRRVSRHMGGKELVQRQQTLVPEAKPSGTKIHNEILPEFGASNPELFTEIKIPGAKKFVVEEGKAGIADFYQATTAVALNFDQGQPAFLGPDSKARKGREKWRIAEQRAKGAPIGPETGSQSCSGGSAGTKICRLDQAPTQILLGDLKPAASDESTLGEGQLQDYIRGLDNTTASANSFAAANPTLIHPSGRRWRLSTGRIASLTVPPKYEFNTAGTPIVPLGPYVPGRRRSDIVPGLRGRLIVYKDPDVAGIWVYEWVPTAIPANLRTTASKEFTDILNRLERLIQELRSPPAGGAGIRRKALTDATHSRPHTRATQPTTEPVSRAQIVQRAGRRFNYRAWRNTYRQEWRRPAKQFIEGSRGAPLRAVAAIMDIKKRSRIAIPTAAEFRPMSRQFNKVEHWVESGGTYGLLRRVFGRFFEKISDLYEKAKRRFRRMAREKPVRSSGSGLTKAIITSAFRMAGNFFQIIIGRVTDSLKTALGKGAEAMLEHFFGEENLAKLAEAKAELETMQTRLEEAVAVNPEELIQKMTEPYEKELEFLADVGKWLGDVNKIVRTIRWAARAVNCATPPGVGCLKIILQEATERMLAKVVETCWFQREFVLPVFKELDFFKTLPDRISQLILDQVKSWIPVDDELKNKLFADIPSVSAEITPGEIDCDRDKLTPEQIAMAELRENHGKEKVEQLIALLEKAGVGDRVPLTIDHIDKMDEVLSQVTDKEVEQALENYDRSQAFGTIKLDEMANAIKQVAGDGAASSSADTDGGTGGAGGGGGVDVIIKDASDARFEGTVTATLERTWIEVANPDFVNHTKHSRPAITLVGKVDDRVVARVENVPAEVLKRPWVDRNTQTHLMIHYRLLQGVRFDHNVPGVPPFGVERDVVIRAPTENPWPLRR
jgi:hypothetical protein